VPPLVREDVAKNYAGELRQFDHKLEKELPS